MTSSLEKRIARLERAARKRKLAATDAAQPQGLQGADKAALEAAMGLAAVEHTGVVKTAHSLVLGAPTAVATSKRTPAPKAPGATPVSTLDGPARLPAEEENALAAKMGLAPPQSRAVTHTPTSMAFVGGGKP